MDRMQDPQHVTRQRRRSLIAAGALLAALSIAATGFEGRSVGARAGSGAQQDPVQDPKGRSASTEERIAATRAALEEWMEQRRLIAKLRAEWDEGREILQARIDVTETEIADLRERIAKAEEGISGFEEQRSKLERDKERLKEASSSLESQIGPLEQQTRQLVARLPHPLQEKLKTLTQRIPEDPENTELGLGLRFQNIVGILDMANKFNNEVADFPETLTLAEGKRAEVTAIYIGVGQAYYLSDDGKSAGIGFGGPEGWTWRPQDDIAPQVRQLLDILGGQKAAEFVTVPMRVQ